MITFIVSCILMKIHVCVSEAAALLKRQDLSDLISKFETVFPGDGENFPNNGDLCKVHYTARIVGTTDLLESRQVRKLHMC